MPASEQQRRWIERRAPVAWIQERRELIANAEVSVVERDGRPYRLLRLPDAPVPDPLLEPRTIVARHAYARGARQLA